MASLEIEGKRPLSPAPSFEPPAKRRELEDKGAIPEQKPAEAKRCSQCAALEDDMETRSKKSSARRHYDSLKVKQECFFHFKGYCMHGKSCWNSHTRLSPLPAVAPPHPVILDACGVCLNLLCQDCKYNCPGPCATIYCKKGPPCATFRTCAHCKKPHCGKCVEKCSCGVLVCYGCHLGRVREGKQKPVCCGECKRKVCACCSERCTQRNSYYCQTSGACAVLRYCDQCEEEKKRPRGIYSKPSRKLPLCPRCVQTCSCGRLLCNSDGCLRQCKSCETNVCDKCPGAEMCLGEHDDGELAMWCKDCCPEFQFCQRCQTRECEYCVAFCMEEGPKIDRAVAELRAQMDKEYKEIYGSSEEEDKSEYEDEEEDEDEEKEEDEEEDEDEDEN